MFQVVQGIVQIIQDGYVKGEATKRPSNGREGITEIYALLQKIDIYFLPVARQSPQRFVNGRSHFWFLYRAFLVSLQIITR